MHFLVQDTETKKFFHMVANNSVLFGPKKDGFQFNSESEGQDFIELSEIENLIVVEA